MALGLCNCEEPREFQRWNIPWLLASKKAAWADPAAPATQDPRGKVERPGPKAAAWATFCKPFADRYLKLAAAPAGMPSVALAFSRATLLRPDNLELADLRDGAQRAVPAAPSPAGQADPAEAKRLHRLADPLRNAKRFPEAIAEYQKIVALDPTDVDAWCDLADCLLNANKDKTSPLAAVCAAQARDELAWANLPSQTVRALRARIKTLTKLDPTLDEVEAVDREFAAKARLLAVEAAGAGDLETAGEIQAVIAVIAPPNPDCDDESDADNLALKINARDMAGTPVNVKPALQRDPITGEDVITATPLDSAKGLSLTLAPGKWTWANDLRIRWQIEPLKVEQKGVILVNCWPVGGSGTRVEELLHGQ